MATRNRLPPWHEELKLRNGRRVLIRPIRPEDGEPLRAAFPLLQPEEVRQRFLHAVSDLSPAMTERLTRAVPKTEFALVAAEPYPPGEALVGAVARASIVPGTRDAEFAILVSHYLTGMGLGRHLMRRLVRWAKGRRLERIHGDVLEHNQPMISLAESLDFHREPLPDQPSLVRMVLALRAPPPH
jgi:RimJ/RimL family protein N-acetyltransferase